MNKMLKALSMAVACCAMIASVSIVANYGNGRSCGRQCAPKKQCSKKKRKCCHKKPFFMRGRCCNKTNGNGGARRKYGHHGVSSKAAAPMEDGDMDGDMAAE